MRILLLNDDVLPSARGGSAVVVDLLRRSLTQRGHAVTLVTTHQDSTRKGEIRWSDDGGTIISLFADYPLAERHRRCIRNHAISARLEKIMAEVKPEIVHAHVIHTYLTYESLVFARRHTERVFLTAHDTFLVSFHRVKGPRYEQALATNTPYRMKFWEHVMAAGMKYTPTRNREIRRILGHSGTSVIAVSDALARFLEDNGVNNVATIHNATAIPPTPSAESIAAFRQNHRLTGPTILYGGRISEDKGIDALLEALRHILATVPAAQLLVLGDEGKLQSHLERQSSSVREAVHAAGWVDAKTLPVAFAAADVVTTPSIYLDAFNLMNIEGMAAGKPIVGTCFGGTPEIIVNDVTGFVRNPNDAQSFSDPLARLLTDKGLAGRMGDAGRKRVEEKFSVEKFTDAHLLAYERSTEI